MTNWKNVPHALVTGGAGGIGSAVCRLLARKGYRVFVLDLPSSEGEAFTASLNTEAGGHDQAVFVAADLEDLAALESRITGLLEQFGPFEVLVNNAAIDTMGPLESTSAEEFLRTQRINAESAYILCRLLAPGMKSLGRGQIVSVMSIILSGGWADRAPYAMSKGALLGLTRSLARELGPYRIRVNAVSPGAVPTAMERKFWKDDRSELDAVILEKQSLKFRAEPEDIANAVWFLVSEESRFITGHELHVNGGWYMG